MWVSFAKNGFQIINFVLDATKSQLLHEKIVWVTLMMGETVE